MATLDDFETTLRAALSKDAFLDLCLQQDTPDVIVDRAALLAYADTLTPLKGGNFWTTYLGCNRFLKTDFRELAVSTVQQGGYLYPAADGSVQCWAVEGNEVRALLDRVDAARAQAMLPGVQQRSPSRTRAVLKNHFDGAPFAQERLALWAELADPVNQRRLGAAFDRAGRGRRYHFDFSSLKDLAAALPLGLGEDPFLKKAALLCILFAGVAAAKNNPVPVTLDMPVPADWRDPQTLHNVGGLRYADALVDRLDSGALLAESDPYVTQIRIATIVAGQMILDHRRDLTLQDVDGALWFAGRLFDVPAARLPPDQAAARAGLEAIARRSSFSERGFLRVSNRAMNVATLRF